MADFRRTKFGGEFGAPYFFGGFSADHFLAANSAIFWRLRALNGSTIYD